MSHQDIKRGPRLRAKSIFLSASVPSPERSERFQLVPDAQVQIEEAVVSLTRAVLVEGGQLVLGGHPSISPLVGLVAAEYALPRHAEGEDRVSRMEQSQEAQLPLIRIFQSEAFREYLPDETWQLFRQGFATIDWVEAVDNERCNPQVRGEPQCQRSLSEMRRVMLEQTSPVAMICIGGMEGVIDEANLYRKMFSGGRIYVFETTGGAAQRLTQEMEGVRVFDREILNRLRESSPERIGFEDEGNETGMRDEEAEHNIRVIPYPLIAQLLIQEIAQRESMVSR